MGARVQRFDFAGEEVGAITRTPQGGIRVRAAITRTGVLVYRTTDGKEVREYRSPVEVFKPESVATLNSAPVTREHPAANITVDTYRGNARGNVVEGSITQAPPLLEADLTIQDSELLSDIEARIRVQVSAGYGCVIDYTPGISPEGEPYDQAQTQIEYNHVAIVQKGRAGDNVCLRLDSAGNFIGQSSAAETDQPEGYNAMKSIRIDGVEYPLNTDAEIQAANNAHLRHLSRLESEAKQREANTALLTSRADSAEAQAKELAAENAKLKVQLADARRFDAEDTALLTKAAQVMGADFKPEGMSPEEIMSACVAKAFPAKDLKGASPDYIRGLFEAIPAPDAANMDATGEERRPATTPRTWMPPAKPAPRAPRREPAPIRSRRCLARSGPVGTRGEPRPRRSTPVKP